MPNLYCYSEKINYQTSNEQEFTLFKQQALIEGLKMIESDFFPYKVDDSGKLILDEDGKPIILDNLDKFKLGILDFKTEKERIKKLINSDFEKSFSEITAKYPQHEREGWFFLTSECENWLSHKNTKYIPALHAECQLTDNEDLITAKANEILEKSYSYKSFYGQMKSLKSERLKKLESASLEDLEILEKEILSQWN